MADFSTLRGQQPQAVEALSAALRSGRLHHAYLLTGSVETTLEHLAWAAATAIACQHGRDGDSCGACTGCRKLTLGNHPDVVHIAPSDKGTIAIDQVRAATARLGLRATLSSTKVVVLQRAEAMNHAAQNALLKTLEEPPGATCFLLTTSRPRALLPTVRSRCQQVRLRPQSHQGAWQSLAQSSNVSPLVAQYVTALCGADRDRAEALIQQGAPEIVEQIAGLLQQGCTGASVLHLASELGGDRDKAEMALALLEVASREALASHRGVPREQWYVPDQEPIRLPTSALCEAAARLQLLRRQRVFNPNRTLALESVLMALANASGGTSKSVTPQTAGFSSKYG